MLTVDEAAEITGKSAYAIRCACRNGTLKATEVQGHRTVEWRIQREDLDQWARGIMPDGSIKLTALADELGMTRAGVHWIIESEKLPIIKRGRTVYLSAQTAKKIRKGRTL